MPERDGFLVVTESGDLRAMQVVVAAGAYAVPRVPEFARDFSPDTVQVHASGYRNPAELPGRRTAVVGAGNSGAEIALELAASREIILAGPDTGHIPIPVPTVMYRALRRTSVDSWIGGVIASKVLSGGNPLIRVHPKDLVRAGVTRAPRVVAAAGGRPVLDGGQVLDDEAARFERVEQAGDVARCDLEQVAELTLGHRASLMEPADDLRPCPGQPAVGQPPVRVFAYQPTQLEQQLKHPVRGKPWLDLGHCLISTIVHLAPILKRTGASIRT